LFAAIDPRVVGAWLASAVVRSVALGETLLDYGTPGSYAYLVDQGRVRVLRHGKGGREIAVGTYGPGELFGEYALLPPGLNTATCRAASPGRLLQMPLDPIREAIAEDPAVAVHLKRWLRLHAVLAHLRDRSFLGFLSATSILELLHRCQTVRFEPGQTIQADGLSDSYWFAIFQGTVIVRPSAGVAAFPLGSDECFGERALLGRPPLPLVEAVTATQCMALHRDAFFDALREGDSQSKQTVVGALPPGKHSWPWVAQQEAAECGLAALAMVARFYGHEVPLADLRRVMRLTSRGASMLQLQHAAGKLGFHGQAVRVATEQLDQVTLPAIAHLVGDHYVVIYARGPEDLVIGDPARGVVTVPTKAFCTSWSRTLLLLARVDPLRQATATQRV
jgi:ATP-binding cassette subfamily B protein